MSKILVTGGAGFIGYTLCKRLLEAGHTVVAIDNYITSTKKNAAELQKNNAFIFLRHDITSPFPRKIEKYLKNIDAIYHLACPTGVPNVVALAEEMLLTCSTGTVNILELAKENNASVVFASSSEVYGDPKEFPQTEDYAGNVNPVGIRSPYEEGKRFSESLCMMYARKYNIDIKIVRIFNTYGPGMSLKDTRVIPTFINCLKTNKSFPIAGKGVQKRTFCYIDDLVRGVEIVMKKGKKGEVYNVGSDIESTIIDVVKMIRKLSERPIENVFVTRPVHDHNARRPALDKVKKLGWRQEVSLEEGLKKTLEWYQLVS